MPMCRIDQNRRFRVAGAGMGTPLRCDEAPPVVDGCLTVTTRFIAAWPWAWPMFSRCLQIGLAIAVMMRASLIWILGRWTTTANRYVQRLRERQDKCVIRARLFFYLTIIRFLLLVDKFRAWWLQLASQIHLWRS